MKEKVLTKIKEYSDSQLELKGDYVTQLVLVAKRQALFLWCLVTKQDAGDDMVIDVDGRRTINPAILYITCTKTEISPLGLDQMVQIETRRFCEAAKN